MSARDIRSITAALEGDPTITPFYVPPGAPLSGTKISELLALEDPVESSAVIPLVQSGTTFGVTPSQLSQVPYTPFILPFNGLSMAVAGALPLWTVPAGLDFMFTGASIRIEAVTGAIEPPLLSWRITNSAELAIGGGGLVSASYDAVDEVNFSIHENSAYKVARADTVVYFLVITPGPFIVSAYVRGFYVEA